MSNKVLCIGEAYVSLVDQLPLENDKTVNYRLDVDGGATKVACAIAKLGGEAKMVAKLGFDNFGQMIYDCYSKCGVDTSDVIFDEELRTGIKFEHRYEDRVRTDCYIKHSANTNLKIEELSEDILEDVCILHFSSLSLMNVKMRKVLNFLIRNALLRDITISFDIDLKMHECNNLDKYRELLASYLNVADIVRISSKEFNLLTNTEDIQDGLDFIFGSGVKKIIYTMGEDGARIYYADNTYLNVKAAKAITIDKAGVTEAFIGSYLYFVSTNYELEEKVRDYIAVLLANKCAAYAYEGEGAIEAYISNADIMN